MIALLTAWKYSHLQRNENKQSRYYVIAYSKYMGMVVEKTNRLTCKFKKEKSILRWTPGNKCVKNPAFNWWWSYVWSISKTTIVGILQQSERSMLIRRGGERINKVFISVVLVMNEKWINYFKTNVWKFNILSLF